MKKNFYLVWVLIILFFNGSELSYSQSVWETDNGWAKQNGKRFFAIGAWGLKDIDRDYNNQKVFQNYQDLFNLILVQTGDQQEFMKKDSQAVFLSGVTQFDWRFRKAGYKGDPAYFSNDNDILNYEEMNKIRQHFDYFDREYIPSIADEVKKQWLDAGYDLIWMLCDEPDSHIQNRWFWHPDLIKSYHNAAHATGYNILTYVGLLGNLRGSIFQYERVYKSRYRTSRMPNRLPSQSDGLGGNRSEHKTYMYSYDGTPVYELKQGKWVPKSIDYFIRNDLVYNTVKHTAEAYSAADILGLNAYANFRDFPFLAGLVVDALKDGAGADKPIWNYYDAWGKYVKGSTEEYLTILKSQVIAGIIHGSTGVLFWGGRYAEETYWESLKDLIKEIHLNKNILEHADFASAYWPEDRTRTDAAQWMAAKHDSGNRPRYFLYTVNFGDSIQAIRVPEIGEMNLMPQSAGLWSIEGANIRELTAPGNLGFEKRFDQSTGYSKNWKILKSGNTIAEQTDSEKFMGSNSLYLADQDNNAHAVVEQFFDCLPNATYRLQAWYKTISGNQNLIIQFYDQEKWVAEEKVQTSVADEWQLIQLTGLTPPSVTRIKIHIGSDPSDQSVAFWDEVMITLEEF